ncbi:MAG TPA: exodeoxyribonuclease VII small subunit [Thermomicrobiales bacterium]|nr:exodeoxyribonuclease VII small subunit [Thermomicrobiales bacterium]
MTSNGPTEPSVEQLSFEDALTQLQDVVVDLESGTLTLEASLERYKAGAELAVRCQHLIAEAELRIVELTPDTQESTRP